MTAPQAIVPREVVLEVVRTLDPEGDTTGFRIVNRLGGGCMHPAARVETVTGKVAFLKWANGPGSAPFLVEARGLQALGRHGGVRVPDVIGVEAGGPGVRGWLLLEYVERGAVDGTTPRRLGEGLARLHRRLEWAEPGWEEDGWIGSLPQVNRWPRSPFDTPPVTRASLDWPTFWRDLRLQPRWEAVAPLFDVSTRVGWDRLMDRLDTGLDGWEEDGLSLLHGDLWSGNAIADRSGGPVLVDPAVYRGHREVDLAMMELFGGFDPLTLRAYRASTPLVPGYDEVRRDLYQLYPLLVHVELFGGGYVAGVRDRVRRSLAKLG